MVHRRIDQASLALNLLQLVLDAAGSLAGFAFAFALYKDSSILDALKHNPHEPLAQSYYFLGLAFAGLVLISFTVKGLYHSRETGLMNMDEATGVLQGLFFSGAILLIGSYYKSDPQTTEISRLILALGVALGGLFVLIARALGFKLRRYLQTRGHFFRRVVICGAGESGRAVARKLLHCPKFHVLPVAFVDSNRKLVGTEIDCLSGHEAVPVAGTLDELAEVLDRVNAHEIWIALPGEDQENIIDVAQVAEQAGLPCRFVPNLFNIPLETLTVDSLGGLPLLSIKPRAEIRPMPVWKRTFDIVFSLAVLLLTLPLWPILVLLVRATSKGPAFFAHERVGQGGRTFRMYKFRTMYSEAPAYAETPRRSDDRRITPVGRWLRRLSVDELPQFWNVLKGDMSVVGPRPEMPQIVARYTPQQRQRLSVKPGITGIWQISADRRNPIHENLDYDLYYIEKQSFFLDIMIILTTGVYGARGV